MSNLISPLLPVMLPVLICAFLGVLWSRFRQPFDQEFVRRAVMWIGAPALIIATFGQTGIGVESLKQTLLVSATLLALNGLFAAVFLLVSRLSLRNFMVPLVFGNSGNMGLPLCLFAFGEEGLALSLGVFLTTSILHFSVGVAVLDGRAAIKSTTTSPLIWAGVLAMSMVFGHWQLPQSLLNSLDILGGMAIPLMLITLGVSLSSLRMSSAFRSVMLGVARLGLSMAAGFAAVWLLDVDGLLRKVILLQAAMPSAVFNYLLAMQYGRSPSTVAGLVVSSTLLSFITIPALLLYLGL